MGRLQIIQGKAEGTVCVAIRESYPAYEGPTEITPTTQTQVLQTEMKTVTSNITVGPIPQNYGLITWDGSVLTVS